MPAYEDSSEQRAYCLKVVDVMDGVLAMLKVYAASDLCGSDAILKQILKVKRWLTECRKELLFKKRSAAATKAYLQWLKKFDEYLPAETLEDEAAARCIVELFFVSLFMEYDSLVRCPIYTKSQSWIYLDMTADTLGRMLMRAMPGADEAGTAIHLSMPD